MNSVELRTNFLEYFMSKGHQVVPSASLIPENDPTVLFTTAGMHPLVPYLLGEAHPSGKRLASSQKCIRTDDIDEVGDKVHHTFFEMLGNWSLGDYFKKEAIEWSFEFLTDPTWMGIDKNKLAVSVFAGDNDAPFDQEAYDKWLELGIDSQRIAKLPKKNNWWGPAGETGPCGPDSEMFYWTGSNDAPANFQETCDDSAWVEIWNDVFMQYNSTAHGVEVLEQKNVDTGMGLERMLAVISGSDDNYRTDLFWPIVEKIQELSGKKYEESEKYFRIVADHIKAAVFAVGDGAIPSNKSAGYVVRRLVRRAIVKGQQLGITKNFMTEIAITVFDIYTDIYPFDQQKIIEELTKEESKFRNTINRGLLEFEKIKNEINGEKAFNLYQTFGFPWEMTAELAEEQGIMVDKSEFERAFKAHQELSRSASAGMFKGGLADSGEMAIKYHTATHLLHQALRQVLGEHVQQKGSNINSDRLRFDFSHSEKMSSEQILEVEKIINEQIVKDLPVFMEEMSPKEAKNSGALGFFENKYGDVVKVYTIGNPSTISGSREFFSKEICGGPHVDRIGTLGHFKIKKEEASSAGIRRIKAVLE